MATRLALPLPPIDRPLAVATAGLMLIGLLMVFSATAQPGLHQGLWIRQLVWAVAAFGLMWLVAAVHYRVFDTLAYPLYGVSMALLVLVLIMGESAYGARRWLELGPLRFQPSELAKIATVLVLARRLDDQKLDLKRLAHWLPAVLLALVPFALVIKQPDLGTSLSFPVILITMLYWAGMPVRNLLLGVSPVVNFGLMIVTGTGWWFWALFAGMFPLLRRRRVVFVTFALLNAVVTYAIPHIRGGLADYQTRRIETFLNPGQDPHGAGYQIIQSKIAIGSGGLVGKGYLQGTQKGLAFLPMRHTDFIYSVVGEELGLIGALTVVLLYALLILRGVRLAVINRNGFASLMSVGLVAALFYHVMVNMLMTIGWAPVTGLPLPLLSYGGTALVANGVAIGLLQNVALRRREF